MAGGWQGSPGHAMLYLFTKREDGKYDFCIFNTGAGIEDFHTIIDSSKPIIHPVVRYEKVTAEELCLPKSDLIAKLIEFRQTEPKADQYVDKQIYSGLFGHINHKRAPVPQDPIGLMTGQRSGTCAYRVFLPLLCMIIGDNQEYKQWKLNFQFIVMCAFFQYQEKNLPKSDTNRLLLIQAAKNMQLTAAKLFGKKLIREEEAIRVIATCRDLLNEIEKIEKNDQSVQSVHMLWPKKVERDLSHLEVSLKTAQRELTRPSQKAHDINIVIPPQFTEAPKPEHLRDLLQEIVNYSTHPKGGRKQESTITYLIEKLCYLLPLESAYWQAIPTLHVSRCLSLFNLITESYANIILNPGAKIPQQKNTALSLGVFVHQLALIWDKGSLKQYGIDIQPFLSAGQDVYSTFFRQEDFIRRQKLIQYFERLPQQKKLFDFPLAYFINPKNVTQWLNSPDFLYFSELLKDHEGLKIRLDSLKAQYAPSVYSDEVWRAAIILVSAGDHQREEINHGPILRNTIFLARLIAGQANGSDRMPGYAQIIPNIAKTLNDPTGLSVWYLYGNNKPIQDPWKTNLTVSGMHRAKNRAELYKLVNESAQFKKHKRAIQNESEVLTSLDVSQKQAIHYDALIACTQCEPNLQPAKIIYYFREHLELLEDPDQQTLFDLIFFKATIEDYRERVPLFDELKKNPQLMTQCIDLIQRGLKYYWDEQPECKPKIMAALFFIRLAQRLVSLVPKAPIPINIASLLNQWLDHPQLSAEELSAIHLHRAHHYTLLPPNQLEKKEIEQLIISWMLSQNLPTHPHWRELDIQTAVRDFVYDHSNLFASALYKNDEVMNLILKLHNLVDEPPKGWKDSFPIYSVDCERGKFWKINVLTAQICSEEGLAQIESPHDFTQNESYKRLFGEARFHHRVIQDYAYFSHPQMGRIRISLSTEKERKTIIQRQIREAWWQYIPPQLLGDEIPLVLRAEHSHWMSIDNGNLLKAYDLKTGNHAFELNTKKGISTEKSLILSVKEAGQFYRFTSFQSFERDDSILVEVRGAEIRKISLPRYHSENKEPLTFYMDQGNLRWSGNQAFSVVRSDTPPKVLGNFTNVILLQDQKTGKQKALVPCREFLWKNTYDRNCVLDIQNQNQTMEEILSKTHIASKPQNGIYPYLEFDIQGSDLIPLSQEGQLMLAYLYLGKKEYLKVYKRLMSITSSDFLSSLDKWLLKMVISRENQRDYGPSSSALRIHAALVLAKDSMRPKEENHEDLKAISDWVQQALQDYEKAPSKVLGELQLKEGDYELLDKAYGVRENFNQPIHRTPLQSREILCHPDLPLVANLPCKSLIDLEASGLNEQESALATLCWKPGKMDGGINQTFSTFYAQALEANDHERLLLAHQIELYSQFDKEKDDTWCVDRNELYRWLHFALRYPKLAPDLLPEARIPAAKILWIRDLRKIYDKKETEDAKIKKPTHVLPKFPIPASHRSTLELDEGFQSMTDKLTDHRLLRFLDVVPKVSLEMRELAATHMVQKELDHEKLDEARAPKPLHESELSKEEEPFAKAIESAFAEFTTNFERGKKINAEQFEYDFPSLDAMEKLGDSLEQRIQTQELRVEQWQKMIVALANAGSDQFDHAIMKTLLQGGGYLKKLDLEECINIFVRKSFHKLRAINRNLSSDDIETLMQMVQAFLIEANELAQAKRALKDLEEVKKKIGAKAPEHEIASAIHQVGIELSGKMEYDPITQHAMLVFEYRTNIRLRKVQVELILKICKMDPATKAFQDIVAQLMMGGGKTSVIASLILMICADGHHIPIYIALAAQFESIRKNLGPAQKHNFDQSLRAIDLSRSHFTLENLKWIRKQIEEAQELKDPLLFKAEKVQALQLEYLALLEKASEMEESKEKKALLEKVAELQKINTLLLKFGRPIFDEIDVLLNPNFATNFPIGETEKLKPHQVDLFRQIFELLISDELMVDGRSVNSIVRLGQNRSSAMPPSVFHQKVMPVIARKLAETNEDLMLQSETMITGFVRFVSKQMEREKLTEEDHQFFETLRKMFDSPDQEERDAVELIRRTKHLFQDILSPSLGKSVGRKFGRSRKSPNGEVVPFLGVDAESTRKFADPWEAACAHFITAAARGISENQVVALAEVLRHGASHSARKTKVNFDQTPEAREFSNLTFVRLSKMGQEGDSLKKATQNVNRNGTQKLNAEAELICKVVEHHPEYLSSNPQDFANQFPKGSRVGLTGTPYNFPCYPRDLSRNIEWDTNEVDGRIIDMMLSRSRPIISLDTDKVKEMLQKAFEKKVEIRGIIDTAGIFRDYDNKTVAEQILNFFKDHKEIDTVLYFGRRTPDEVLPDHLMALRKGMNHPIFIGKTGKIGIPPEKCFTIYDERHCEATDIKQVKNARFLMTTDEKTILRAGTQGALRLREYLMRQDVLLTVSKESQARMLEKGISVDAIVRTVIKNQAIQISRDTLRAYKQRIRGAVRQCLIKKLLATDPVQAPVYYQQYREVFVTTHRDSLFERNFELEIESAPLKVLAACRKRWIDLLSSKTKDREILQAVEKETQEVLNDAEQNRFLPLKTLASQSEETEEMQIELDLQTETEVETTQEMALDKELLQELQQYTQQAASKPYTEKHWTKQQIDRSDFPQISNYSYPSDGPERIFPLNEMMAKKTRYKAPYSQIFDKYLLATNNWALTTLDYLPVFHPKQKSAHQLLVILKDHIPYILFLSIQDAAFFKDYLAEKQPKHMWMILADGKEISTHPHTQSDHLSNILQYALIEVNFFNGNARYLDEHSEKTQAFFEAGHADLKRRFLRLKVESDPVQKAIFYHNEILNPNFTNLVTPTLSLLKAEKEKQRTIKHMMNPEKIPAIDPLLVPYITKSDLIQYLQTDKQISQLNERQIPYLIPPQVRFLQSHQIPHIPPRRPELLNALPNPMLDYLYPIQIKQLNRDKLRALAPLQLRHITLNQVPMLDPRQLCDLPDPLIEGVSETQVPYLSPNRFKLLITPEQIRNIPPQHIPYQGMPDIHIPHFRGAQVDKTPDSLIQYLTPVQIKELTSPLKIQHIALRDVDHCVPAQLRYLTYNQIRALTDQSLIQGLDENNVGSLAPNQIPLISNEQIPHIFIQQVHNLRGEQVKVLGLDRVRVQNVDPTQINYLDDSQLSLLSIAQVRTIEEINLIQRLPPIQLPHLHVRNIKYVHPRQVPHLQNEQLEFLETLEQIQEVPAERLNHLKSHQIGFILPANVPHLNDELIPYLRTPDQIQQVPLDKVPFLTIFQLIHIGPHQFTSVPPDQIGLINPNLYTRLNTPEQIAKIPEERYQYMSREQARIRFGGPIYAIGLAIIGLVGQLLRTVFFLITLPLAPFRLSIVARTDDQIARLARRLGIAVRIWR